MTWIVYRHTCTESGKSYVGYTKKTLEQRWTEHVHEAIDKRSRRHFHRAIRKHDVGSWTHSVLEECRTQEEATARETFWIDQLKTFTEGYNMTPGGDGVKELSEHDRKRHRKATVDGMSRPGVRERMVENLTAAMNRPATRERQVSAQRLAQNRPEVKARRDAHNADPKTREKRSRDMKAAHARPETKERHVAACRRSNLEKKAKRVQQVSLEGIVVGEFVSASEASKKTGTSRSGISNCARGLYPSIRGFTWHYIT